LLLSFWTLRNTRFENRRMKMDSEKPKSKRGFAAMSPERQREIASMGGKAVPNASRAYSRDPALAAKSGRKGGQAVRAEKRQFSRDRELAAEAGRKGGCAAAAKRKKPV
jgi:general stress protein YciG